MTKVNGVRVHIHSSDKNNKKIYKIVKKNIYTDLSFPNNLVKLAKSGN